MTTTAQSKIRKIIASIALVLSVAASASAFPIVSNLGHFALADTNGTKTVVGRFNTLHLVFEGNQQIFHTSSTDGVNWSAPQQLSIGPSATTPTIAVNAVGDLAVAYISDPSFNGEGELFYTYKRFLSPWSAPVRVYNTLASAPTMVGYGRDVHLAWVDLDIFYTSFQLDFPPQVQLSSSDVEQVAAYSFCCGQVNSMPSIAVARRDKCNRQTPIVRVGYFKYESTPGQTTIEANLSDRDPGGWLPLTTIYSGGGWSTVPQGTFPISSSLAANRRTGDFYFASSFMADSVNTSELVRVDKAGSFNVTNVAPGALALMHVAAAQSSCSDGLRLASSEFQVGGPNGSYGLTRLRTGQWTPGTGSPSWASTSSVGTSGRDPQAVYWSRCAASTAHRVGIAYDRYVTQGTSDLESDYSSSGGCSPGLLCLDPRQLCFETVINIASTLRIAGGGFGNPGEVGEVAIEVKNDAVEPFKDLVTLDVELPAGVELLETEGEDWHCEAAEGRQMCFSRLEVLEPGTSSELLLTLKSTGESPGEDCGKETPCDQLCVLAEPEEDDNPEDNRACLSLGSAK